MVEVEVVITEVEVMAAAEVMEVVEAVEVMAAVVVVGVGSIHSEDLIMPTILLFLLDFYSCVLPT